MDCPECGRDFSMTVGPVVHGQRVRRTRHCVFCRAEWQTVEITMAEHAEFERASAIAEESRRQIARLWGER